MPLKPAFQPLAASKYPNSRLKHSELKNHQPLQPQPHLQQHRANHDSSGSNMIYLYIFFKFTSISRIFCQENLNKIPD